MVHWYYAAVRLLRDVHASVTALALACRPAPCLLAGVPEVSRFSCMKFPDVFWVLRLRGTVQGLALAPLLMLPSPIPTRSASRLLVFEAQSPSPPVPLFTLRLSPRGEPRKTQGRVGRYSFLVRLFHSLLHAGLSRRTGNPVGTILVEINDDVWRYLPFCSTTTWAYFLKLCR